VFSTLDWPKSKAMDHSHHPFCHTRSASVHNVIR
jgi:hypothetical protein